MYIAAFPQGLGPRSSGSQTPESFRLSFRKKQYAQTKPRIRHY